MVRVVTAAGAVTTLAGRIIAGTNDGIGTSAAFNVPYCTAFSSTTQRVIVADYANNRIRAIVISSAVVSTFAGSGSLTDVDGPLLSAGIGGPTGVAVDSTTDAVFVVNRCALRRVFNGLVITLAGALSGLCGYVDAIGTDARFSNPWGVAVSSNGIAYVADQGNACIRAVTSLGIVTTFSGRPDGGAPDSSAWATFFVLPSGIASFSSGALAVTEAGGHALRLIMPSGTTFIIAGSSNGTAGNIAPANGTLARFRQPLGIAVINDTVYVTDTTNNLLKAARCALCPLGSVCSRGVAMPCPAGTFGSSPGVCSGCSASPGSACYEGSISTTGMSCFRGFFCSGGMAAALPCTCPAACQRMGIAEDPIGSLTWTSSVFAGSGATAYADGTGTNAAFLNPWGLGVEYATGVVYVLDSGNFVVRRILPSGSVTLFAGTPGISGFQNGPALSSLFCSGAQNIAHDSKLHRVVVADCTRVRVISFGVVSTLAGSATAANIDGIATNAAFSGLSGIAVDSDSVVYTSSYSVPIIRAISTTGVVTTLAGNGVAGYADNFGALARFSNPWGLAVAADGFILVADQVNQRLRILTNASAVVSTLAGSSVAGWADGFGSNVMFSTPTNAASFASGAFAVSEYNTGHRIRIVTRSGLVMLAAGSVAAPLSGFADGQGTNVLFNNIVGFGVDSLGSIYLAESGNKRIRKMTCGECPLGRWCTKGASMLCPTGTYGATTTLSSPVCSGSCLAPPGSYCPAGSISPVGVPCPTKFWCAGLAALALPCTCPSLCATTGLSAEPAGLWTSTRIAGSFTTSGSGPSTLFTNPAPTVVNGVDQLAVFYNVRGTFFASQLNALFANDDMNNLIRRIDLSPNGNIVSTFAGGSAAGMQDAIGTAALFNRPLGMCMHPSETLFFVADFSNNRLRQVTMSATVTTAAGQAGSGGTNGVGTNSQFSNPVACAVDGTTNSVYIGEYSAHRMRNFNIATSLVTTVAGTGALGSLNGIAATATFNSISSCAIDSMGSTVYVSDRNNHLIRVIKGGLVSTLAGSVSVSGSADGFSTAAQFSFPEGLALVSNNSLLYVSSTGTSSSTPGTIRQIKVVIIATGQIFTIAGFAPSSYTMPVMGAGLNAKFGGITGITALPNGTLILTDMLSSSIYALTCALCPQGMYCPLGGATVPCPAGSYGATAGLASASSCNVCAASPGAHCPNGGTSAVGVPCPAGSWCAGGVALPIPCMCTAACAAGISSDFSTGPCALSCSVEPLAGSVTAASFYADGLGTNAGFIKVRGLAVAANGDVFTSDDNYPSGTYTKAYVRMISPSGSVTTLAGGNPGYVNGVGTNAAFNRPLSIALDLARNVYVADLNNNNVRIISSAGVTNYYAGAVGGAAGYRDAIGTNALFNYPFGVVVSNTDACLYVSDLLNNLIRKISFANQMVTTLAGGGTTTVGSYSSLLSVIFSNPKGLGLSLAEDILYVGDGLNCVIALGLRTGASSVLAGLCGSVVAPVDGFGTAAIFLNMESIAVDGNGTLWVAEIAPSYRIRTISPIGLVSTIAVGRLVTGAPITSFLQPIAIRMTGRPNRAVIADYDANAISILTCSVCPVGYYCTSGLTLPCPVGTYSPAAGISALSSCLPCNATIGFSCGAGESASVGSPCPSGFYCSGGTALPVLAGTACNTSVIAGVWARPGLTDGPVPTARLYSSRQVAPVSGGIFFTEDSGGNNLRFVALPSMVVSLVAGSMGGTSGFQDGLGSNSLFNRPLGLTCASTSTCYVADFSNNRIRLVSSSGAVTTLAGGGAQVSADGIGVVASFNLPHGIILDETATNLYVSEYGGNKIRKIVISTALVSTVAGSGALGFLDGAALTAKLNHPTGLRVDPSGTSLLVCDTDNRRIRALSLISGIVSTVIGTGVSSNYLAEGWGLAVNLISPLSLVFDSKGVLWIADGNVLGYGGILRRAVTTSAGFYVSVVLGSGSKLVSTNSLASALSSVGGVAIISETAASTKLVVADHDGHVLIQAECSLCPQGFFCTLGTQTPCPAGTWGQGTGLSSASHCIPCTATPGAACQAASISQSGQVCTPGFFCQGGSVPPIPCLCAIACAASGLASEPTSEWTVSTLAGSGGPGLTNGPLYSTQFNSPTGVTVLTNGNILVADYTNNVIRAITLDGTSSTFVGTGVSGTLSGTPGTAQFANPYSVALWTTPDGQGLALVNDAASTTLRGVYLNRTVVTLSQGLLSSPVSTIQDPLVGTIYVADQSNHRIMVYPNYKSQQPPFVLAGSPPAGYVDGLSWSAKFNCPVGVAVLPESFGTPLTIFVADKLNRNIRSISGAGVVKTVAGGSGAGSGDGIGTAATFTVPYSVALDVTSRALYITDSHTIRIMRIDTALVTTIAGGLYAGFADGRGTIALFNSPRNVAFAPGSDGSTLYIADYSNFAVRQLKCASIPSGYYRTKSVSASVLPCPAGTFGATSDLTSPLCSGPCTAAPGFGCALASISPVGTICPIGFFCPGGATPPQACACPNTCLSRGLTNGNGTAPMWTVSTLATFLLNPPYPPRAVSRYRDNAGMIDSLFILDDTPSQIWQYSFVTTFITPFSGVASGGFNDGPANMAKFNRPLALVSYPAASLLYVCDYGNNRLRAVAVPSGVVTTVIGGMIAGGLDGIGTSASLNGPHGIAFDPSMNFLFIVEWVGSAVRRVSLPSMTVVTVAGVSATTGFRDGAGNVALFFNLVGVHVIDGGVVFVADRTNGRIRKLTNATTATSSAFVRVSTLVGNALPGFSDGSAATAATAWPEGLVTADNSSKLYFTDTWGNLMSGHVRLVSFESSMQAQTSVTTIVGPREASSAGQNLVDVDQSGQAAYIRAPMSLILVNSTLITTTANGILKAITCAPCALGHYCENGSPTPCPAGTFGNTTGFSQTSDCLPCAALPGYACTAGSISSLGILCPTGAYCIGGSTPAQPCMSIAACSEGLSADPAPNRTASWRLTLVSGGGAAGTVDGASTTVAIHNGVTGMAFGVPGLFVSDFSANRIRLISGGMTRTFVGNGVAGNVNGVGTNSQMNRPQGLALTSSAQTLYAADYGSGLIRVIDVVSASVTTLVTTVFVSVVGLALDEKGGVLYVSQEAGGCVIQLIVLATSFVRRFAGTGVCAAPVAGASLWLSPVNVPTGIAYDPFNKRILLADWRNHVIQAISTTNGTATIFAGNGIAATVDGVSTSASINGPRGIFIDGVNIIVVEWDGARIRRISLENGTTAVVTTAGSIPCVGSLSLANAYGVVGAGNGSYFISDFAHNRVLRLSSGSPCFIGSYCGTDGVAKCPPGFFGATANLTNSLCSGPCSSSPGYGCASGSSSIEGSLCPVNYFCSGGSAPPVRCVRTGTCSAGATADPFPSTSSPNDGTYWTVTTIAGGGGGINADGLGSSASFQGVLGIALRGDSSLLVAEYFGNRVRRLEWDGTSSSAAMVSVWLGGTLITTGNGLAAGQVDGFGERVRFNKPFGLSVDSNSGVVYVGQQVNHIVSAVTNDCACRTFVGTAGTITPRLGGTSATFNQPDILLPDNGFGLGTTAAYVVEELGCAVRLVNLTTLSTAVEWAGVGFSCGVVLDGVGTNAKFSSPGGDVVQDTNGLLYMTDSNVVRTIDPKSVTVKTLVGSGVLATRDGVGTNAHFKSPRGLALDGRTALFVTEFLGHVVRRVSLDTLVVTTIAGTAGGGADGLMALEASLRFRNL